MEIPIICVSIIQLLNSLEESSLVKKSLESTLNGKGSKSELYESKEQKTESYSKQSRLEETKTSETSETKVTQTAMAEKHTASLVTETAARKVSFSSTTAEIASTATRRKSSVAELTALLARRASGVQTLSESAEAKTHVLMYSGADLQSRESLSTTMRAASREKSAEDKLEEIEGGNRPHFIKTIRGTSIERKCFHVNCQTSHTHTALNLLHHLSLSHF